MKRVLLVDDDPYVLGGLNRLLRKERGRIETVLAESGFQAIEKLETGLFDIVISDMKMPMMDGAELLAHVQMQQPSAIRIVLSGHAEMEAAMRAVPFAHQFLAKPFAGETLKNILDRALYLADLLGDVSMQRAVGAINSVPAIPHVYRELRAALERPTLHIEDLYKIMLKDSALCAKVLQIVNSSFFGLSRRVSNLRDAINLLGIPMTKNMVDSGLVFESLEEAIPQEDGGMERIQEEQQQSLLAAYLCQAMFVPQNKRDDAFMAGLMHNIGSRVVHSCLPEPRREKPAPVDLTATPVETDMNDSMVGAYLLGIWGVPADIVDAIASQDRPEACEGELTLSEALHIADSVATSVLHSSELEMKISADRIQDLQLEERIHEWTVWAEELAWTMTVSL